MTSKTGLGALLTPDNCVLILIDHQPFQFAGLRSHDTQTIINNVVGLAKSAKVYKVPTLLTTVVEERGGYLLKELQEHSRRDALLIIGRVVSFRDHLRWFDRRLLFGLGDYDGPVEIEVHWYGAETVRYRDLTLDRYQTIRYQAPAQLAKR